MFKKIMVENEKANLKTSSNSFFKHIWAITVLVFWGIVFTTSVSAQENSGELVYKKLSTIASTDSAEASFGQLNSKLRDLTWNEATDTQFVGNLRVIRNRTIDEGAAVYLLRKMTGEVFLLATPADTAEIQSGSDSIYAGLDSFSESKMEFIIRTMSVTIDGNLYNVAQFVKKPEQVVLDKVFKICIILMLFFVMVGMGMTLTWADFSLVFKKPKGIILGQILQFGIMPLIAMILGRLLGFHAAYPFIFVGLILITAIPGGVTSNLMTYYAKGDLALSISLTSFSTVLSILFTPLLLAFYCANMPEVIIPVSLVIQTILILVIIPLVVGMGVRKKWEAAAKKATPFFSALGIIALLVLIVAGILSNLTIFTDTARYGVKFYSTLFVITMLGMMSGIIFSKLLGINNYQTRAISLETGLRNSALAMTIALLIQDSMGDFYSSMFVTSGLFGLVMYLAGVISIFLYKYILPIEAVEENE